MLVISFSTFIFAFIFIDGDTTSYQRLILHVYGSKVNVEVLLCWLASFLSPVFRLFTFGYNFGECFGLINYCSDSFFRSK